MEVEGALTDLTQLVGVEVVLPVNYQPVIDQVFQLKKFGLVAAVVDQ